MNSEELKNLIESARVEKGISQRELAKLTGKNVSKEQSDKIVKAVVGDQIPNNLESMID